MNGKIIEFINLAAYDKLGDLQSSLSSGAGQLSSGAVQLSSGAGQVSNGASQVSSGVSQVSDGASEISSASTQLSSAADQISSGSAQIQESSSQLQSSVDVDSMPEGQVKQVVQGSVQLANSSSKLASGSSELAQGSLNLAAGSELLANSAVYALLTASSSLSGDAGSLSSITGVDEELIGDYFYSPIELDKNEIYPVSNFGSQIAPFYIVLSMWIGAVMTCVMIKPSSSAGTKYTPLEMYLGKLPLFILMAMLETIISLIGCFLIGIDILNSAMFILSAFCVAVVFMVFIYSLISALGQVGKALGILLLVFQISSTGGIYPIELMHPFFKMIKPYMPMTYAINLIRESSLGLLWSNYIPSLVFLIIFLVATMIVAILVKTRFDSKAKFFEKRMEKNRSFLKKKKKNIFGELKQLPSINLHEK